MSDSSEDEDLSRFKEAVDTTFTKLINESRGQTANVTEAKSNQKPKSERYLEVASHYNDVKVPKELQKRIGAKVSALINKNIEFVEVEQNYMRKKKVKGGVKLFKTSEGFLSDEVANDTYTEIHNSEAKKKKRKRRQVDTEDNDLNENDKVNAVVISGEYILSKEETTCWKSRRKEKLFKYKSNGKTNILTALE